MIVTKTIRIDDKLHKDATDHIKRLGNSGGFSGYVQNLISNDLKKNEAKVKRATVLDEDQYKEILEEIGIAKSKGEKTLIRYKSVQELVLMELFKSGYFIDEKLSFDQFEPNPYVLKINWTD